MEDLSLHMLDIAENSIAAGADLIKISIEEDMVNDRLTLTIRDNGKGMDEDMVKMVTDPFFTTKTVRKIGLGLPLLSQAAQECDGRFSISSENGKDTVITAVFRRSHIDLQPLGDIPSTFMVLVAGNPSIDFVLEYSKDGYAYRFDTAWIRQELGEVPINTPAVLKLIKEEIAKGVKRENFPFTAEDTKGAE